jgi:hypothetical protein
LFVPSKTDPTLIRQTGQAAGRSASIWLDATSGEEGREADMTKGQNPPFRLRTENGGCDEPSAAKKKPPDRNPAAGFHWKGGRA